MKNYHLMWSKECAEINVLWYQNSLAVRHLHVPSFSHLSKMVKYRIFLLLLLGTTSSTCTYGFSTSQVTRRVSHLSLLPEQGNQLAAACEASLSQQHEEMEADISLKQKHSAARNFVARVFSLPASIFHPHPSEHEIGKEDVTYYSIVGFEFVAGCSKPLPPTMPTTSRQSQPANEALYGWYSPACHLSCPDSDDYAENKLES